MLTRELAQAHFDAKPLAEVVEFLDSRRKPVKQADRTPGPYPYYGANGQQGSIDRYLFDEPLILLAEDGGFFETPERGIAYRISGKSWVNNHAHVLRPRDGLDLAFLCRVLENYDVTPFITGSTRSKLTKAQASSILIPVPPLEEQKRIAAILDKADELRTLRQSSLDRLVRLGMSIFDKHQRRSDGTTLKLSEVCEKITDGTHQSPKWADTGIPFIFVSNIRNQRINFATEKFVSDETYAELTRNNPIEPGDVIYTSVGSYGHAAIVPADKKFVFQRHIAHLKPKPEVIDSTYLMYLLESPSLRQQADRGATGIAQKTVTLRVLKAMEATVPSLEEQRDVVRRLMSIEALRESFSKQISVFRALYSSLQQRAFRGGL